jgi:threonine aldolase
LYALDHNVDRLAEDHANARIIYDALRQVPKLKIEDVETNIVIFDVESLGVTAADVEHRLSEQHVRLSVMGKTRLRAVTHIDVSKAQAEAAARTLLSVLRG